jgi:hypothetical protein
LAKTLTEMPLVSRQPVTKIAGHGLRGCWRKRTKSSLTPFQSYPARKWEKKKKLTSLYDFSSQGWWHKKAQKKHRKTSGKKVCVSTYSCALYKDHSSQDPSCWSLKKTVELDGIQVDLHNIVELDGIQVCCRSSCSRTRTAYRKWILTGFNLAVVT